MQTKASRSRSQKVLAEARARVEMMSAEQQKAAMQRLLGKTAPEGSAAVRAVHCPFQDPATRMPLTFREHQYRAGSHPS